MAQPTYPPLPTAPLSPQNNGFDQQSFASNASDALMPTQAFIEAVQKIPLPKVEVGIDCLVPKQMALKLEAAGVKKGKELDLISMFILAVHAGIFVSMGAGFFTVVLSGTSISYGLQRFAGGLAFCTGLAMVILCGSELFTGNTMLVMAWLTRRITTFQMCRNWLIVYTGNFIGSLIIAAMQVWGRTHENGTPKGAVGLTALNIAQTKCSRDWGACFALGLLCNVMVCWSVWMTLAGRDALDKLLVFLLPISAFAAMGFEHCVANMYFLPIAMMIRTYGSATFWQAINDQAATKMVNTTQYVYDPATGNTVPKLVTVLTRTYISHPDVTIPKIIYMNLIPATMGNMSGAIIFIGVTYWYLYLRDKDHVSRCEWYLGSIPVWASPPEGNRGAKQKKQKEKIAQQAAQDAMMPPQPVSVGAPVERYELPSMMAVPAGGLNNNPAAQPVFYEAGSNIHYPTPAASPNEPIRA